MLFKGDTDVQDYEGSKKKHYLGKNLAQEIELQALGFRDWPRSQREETQTKQCSGDSEKSSRL